MSRRELLTTAAAVGVAGIAAADSTTRDKAATKKKLLIAGAHPDDPETACGGLMALYADAGHEVVSLYLTRGEAGISGKSHEEAAKIRTAEAEAACKILGARPVFAGQIDGATELTPKRYDEFHAILKAERPDIVITHWPIDSHRDHRVISSLVYDAWLRLDKAFELFYFEVEMGRQTQHFWPTDYVNIEKVVERKKQACYAHASQNDEGSLYELPIKMHEFRGQEIHIDYAEAYSRMRQEGGSPL